MKIFIWIFRKWIENTSRSFHSSLTAWGRINNHRPQLRNHFLPKIKDEKPSKWQLWHFLATSLHLHWYIWLLRMKAVFYQPFTKMSIEKIHEFQPLRFPSKSTMPADFFTLIKITTLGLYWLYRDVDSIQKFRILLGIFFHWN